MLIDECLMQYNFSNIREITKETRTEGEKALRIKSQTIL